jgi:hypothetical protein
MHRVSGTKHPSPNASQAPLRLPAHTATTLRSCPQSLLLTSTTLPLLDLMGAQPIRPPSSSQPRAKPAQCVPDAHCARKGSILRGTQRHQDAPSARGSGLGNSRQPSASGCALGARDGTARMDGSATHANQRHQDAPSACSVPGRWSWPGAWGGKWGAYYCCGSRPGSELERPGTGAVAPEFGGAGRARAVRSARPWPSRLSSSQACLVSPS